MPEARTLPIPAAHREFTVKVAGRALGREHQLAGVYVTKAVNRISAARLVYLDGSASASDFQLCNAPTFVPGAEVEILAGANDDPVPLFKGLVVRQGLRVRGRGASQLVVECRHASSRLTVGTKNAFFFAQKDSDIISALLDAAGLDAVVDATTVSHAQQVQFRASDWDFLLTRAEANGKLVFTNDARVEVRAPRLSGQPVCTLQYGATILELDAEIEARSQYAAVKSLTWDPAQQAMLEKEAADPGIDGPGNLTSSDLAQVAALPSYELRHAALAEDEAQVWADAQWMKSKMSKVSGRAKCEGIATVNPGDLVELSGVGERFSGTVFVTGVRQDFDAGQGWKTHLQFGSLDRWAAQEHAVSPPKAGALLPAVNGLQIGTVASNEDPDGEHRVRVRLPLVDAQADGVWARVASLDAGEDRGFFFRPEIGDEVVVGFLEDDPRRAVVLGMLHSSAKAAPLQASDDNHEKAYKSRAGMRLYFDDDKKIMLLETPAGNRMTFSEEARGVKLEDQNGNKIELTPDGIRIESPKALELKGGTQLKLEGQAGAELKSSATTKVQGSLVQIN
ncbi:MAG: type VI secretion system tip protein VgrG [Betaproteobacteria bacterium]|nr:type VI secretion system tip protein VgrG [Betaproteobacteria bacterium]MDH5578219.1 type VI secretion system tip protein VgrG [Betaproteobacteria bacterium]